MIMAEFFENLSDNNRPPKFRYFNGEKWQFSKSKQFVDIVSPVTNVLIGQVSAVTETEIDEALNAAKEAQKEWVRTPLDKRIRVLHLAADWIREHKDILTNHLVIEIGKPVNEAEDEVIRTADLIDYFAERARTLTGEEIRSDAFPGYERDKVAIIEKVPQGLILAIAPFNYPLNLAASKIAPALVTGNTVLFKPATHGSIIGLYLTEIFMKAGVPKGILITVSGEGTKIGDYLVTHPQVNMITFTGSSQVGQSIAKKAGMIPLLFECGGNNPAIVLDDADMDLASTEIVKGAFSFSGQRCTAIKYVLALEPVLKKLIHQVVEKTKKMVKIGDPRSPQTKMVGPIITQTAADEIEKRILQAKVDGAKVVLGGTRKDYFIEPTILDKATPKMEIVSIETFGPVVSFIRVQDINEAAKIVNQSTYGLQASIFTKDEGTGIKLAEKINVGSVQINSKPQRGPDHFPFLGIKGSGVGVQGVRYTLNAMTRPKATVLNKPE